MTRSRREVLGTLAASGALLAGCVGSTDDDAGGSPTSRLPDEPLPEECPAYDNVERVVCYDAVDPGEVPGILEPSTQEITEGEEVVFTLSNRSDFRLQINFYNWLLSKRVDGEWFRIEPREWPEPLASLEPGGTHEWTITADNAGIGDGTSVADTGGETAGVVEGLGGGHYAFRGRGWFEDESHEEAIAFAATFELDAEPIALTPTDAVGSTEWDDDTLVVESTRGDPESGTRGAYELERLAEYDGESRRIITEQLLRNDRRRDAVALAKQHDADRVRLEEYDTTVPIFGFQSDGVFEYQGTYYEVSTAELDG